MGVKNILISQKQPQTASSYDNLKEKYQANFEFKPFFKMEPLTSREFRSQKINISEYTAIVFSARTTIDAFFKICDELRVKIPETLKYFCTTEIVANYLQKHIVYRKRKVFFGDGRPESIMELIGPRHKDEKFLITVSDSGSKDAITKLFEAKNLVFTTGVFVKSVPQDMSGVDIHSYDAVVVFNSADIKAIYANFPDFEQKGIKFITYGHSIVKAMEDAGLSIEISAPSPETPSVSKALEKYLSSAQ